MEVLNLATAALFESLTRNDFEKEQLLLGTHLNLQYMLDVKKKHTWIDFVIMYENASKLLGKEKAAREIAYHGLYADNLSILRKIATGFLDIKTLYWFMGTVACRHLFKDSVLFKYTKIKSNQVRMEISIAPELDDCPLLLETYTYLFENAPTMLGLPKARVLTEISKNKAVYTIHLLRTSYFFNFFSKFKRSVTGYRNAVLLMEDLETQSLQLTKTLEEKSELLRIMTHDISNIVMTMDMSLRKVLSSDHLIEEDKIKVEKIKRNADQLGEILRSVQKVEVAHIRGVTIEGVDVDQVFSSIEDHFKDQLIAKNIKLVIRNNLPIYRRVAAEKTSLELSVLSNLISNAIKFSNNNSFIDLGADLINGEALISVADSGRGIADEERKNLFKIKLRSSTIGTNGEKGTGFGLGIVNTYVALYGGTISAEANYPTGTIIKISLPLYELRSTETLHSLKVAHHDDVTRLF